MKRINVIGSSGSGKSTFARQLAAKLSIPHIEMDRLHWQPNWVEASDADFVARLQSAMAADAWVLDGNYTRTAKLKWQRVDTIVWLDFSFRRTFFQLLRRSMVRALTRREVWPGTGNRESLRRTFASRDSVMLWMVNHYAANREKYLALQASSEHRFLNFVRLTSPAAVQQFLEHAGQQPARVAAVQ